MAILVGSPPARLLLLWNYPARLWDTGPIGFPIMSAAAIHRSAWQNRLSQETDDSCKKQNLNQYKQFIFACFRRSSRSVP